MNQLPHYMLGRHDATAFIEVAPPHPWHRLIHEAAANARISSTAQLEVVVAIEGVVQVFNVREIEVGNSNPQGQLRMAVTGKPWGDPFPIPAVPTTSPVPLAKKVSEALDLLDSLVDPLLDSLAKDRVSTWKKMMRDLLKNHRES